MRKAAAFFAAVAVGTFFAAAARAESVKVGVIAELTGDMPAVGASCRNAAKMAADEVNAAGGLAVGGKKLKVELFVEDNGGKADQSAAAAQKLITQEEVVAIVGPNASRYAIPASEIAESNQTVFITPWSTNPKTTLDATTGKPKRYAFRSCFIDPFQGKVLAKFALGQMKAKKAAVLYDVASDYNKGIAEVFKADYEKLGGKVVAFETYTTNDKDFSAQFTKIKAAAPEVIFLPNYYSEVPLQVQQAKRLGVTAPFLGADAWGSPDLLKLGGADMEGYYFSTHYAADNASPAAVKFIGAYTKAFGAPPDDVAALTYDAFGLLFTALRNAGKSDRESVRNALAKLPGYAGVTGDMKFAEGSGDPIKSAVILQVKGGKFVYVTNAQP
jgi:branched-chain amino acid transport system substrate-binding protein